MLEWIFCGYVTIYFGRNFLKPAAAISKDE